MNIIQQPKFIKIATDQGVAVVAAISIVAITGALPNRHEIRSRVHLSNGTFIDSLLTPDELYDMLTGEDTEADAH